MKLVPKKYKTEPNIVTFKHWEIKADRDEKNPESPMKVAAYVYTDEPVNGNEICACLDTFRDGYAGFYYLYAKVKGSSHENRHTDKFPAKYVTKLIPNVPGMVQWFNTTAAYTGRMKA